MLYVLKKLFMPKEATKRGRDRRKTSSQPEGFPYKTGTDDAPQRGNWFPDLNAIGAGFAGEYPSDSVWDHRLL